MAKPVGVERVVGLVISDMAESVKTLPAVETVGMVEDLSVIDAEEMMEPIEFVQDVEMIDGDKILEASEGIGPQFIGREQKLCAP